jgi:hypothetical protein
MSLQRLSALAALTLLSCLTSCGTSSAPIQAHNPTIQQMDALDVQWGLPKRQMRGSSGPRKFSSPDTGAAASAASNEASRPAAEPAAKPQQNAVDPSVIQGLC